MEKDRSVYALTIEQNAMLKRKYETAVFTIAWLVGVILLLGAMLYFCRSAHAGGFAEVGQSHFIRPAEYIWWQGPYPQEFRTDSGYFRVGYEKGPWRVSWFDLGNYSTRALATSDEALLADGRCNVKTCAPPDYYETRGSVRGLLFSGVYRKGPMFFEGGASITRQSFQLHTETLNNEGRNGPIGAKQNFSGTHTAVGYMTSIGFEYRRFTVSFAYWLNGKASEFYAAGSTPGIDAVKTFSVGYRF